MILEKLSVHTIVHYITKSLVEAKVQFKYTCLHYQSSIGDKTKANLSPINPKTFLLCTGVPSFAANLLTLINTDLQS